MPARSKQDSRRCSLVRGHGPWHNMRCFEARKAARRKEGAFAYGALSAICQIDDFMKRRIANRSETCAINRQMLSNACLHRSKRHVAAARRNLRKHFVGNFPHIIRSTPSAGLYTEGEAGSVFPKSGHNRHDFAEEHSGFCPAWNLQDVLDRRFGKIPDGKFAAFGVADALIDQHALAEQRSESVNIFSIDNNDADGVEKLPILLVNPDDRMRHGQTLG